MSQPVVDRLPPPLWCCYCHATRTWASPHVRFAASPHVRLATHVVDGTSVCARHLSAALAGAREKRRAQ